MMKRILMLALLAVPFLTTVAKADDAAAGDAKPKKSSKKSSSKKSSKTAKPAPAPADAKPAGGDEMK